jgi:diguanylate cyclase (GGDEF)-like protein/PAS domain S-box-containing protein
MLKRVELSAKRQISLRVRGHSEARAVGALLLAGAALVALSLVLPHPSGGNTAALIATSAAMAIVGLLCMVFFRRVPLLATQLLLGVTAAATGLLIVETGVAVGQYGTIFVWATLISSYYFSRRVAAANLAWLLGVYAVSLALVEGTGGYSPLTRWLFSAISLTVVMLLTNILVAHRATADLRARRFFDLSHDMLCTMDPSGRCVEVNGAWMQHLGYSAKELQDKRLLELTHPEDRERAAAEAIKLFKGAASVALETRVWARDGSWHWLRTSSTFAPDEGLVYARSTDITELKRIEGEREELLEKVEILARSDALTGLPNRRALDEQLPREMARARRAGSSLCLALVDIDRFKDYNDSHGHLAGDELLRECAAAWDSVLRGEDTIVRFGGEEFLIVLPGCSSEQAAEVVERLRVATPGDLTCSAGLARWDLTETVDSLLNRADNALYEAKAEGRDRLVEATG